MDNNKKTTKFLPQGHAPGVKKQQLSLHTFSDTTKDSSKKHYSNGVGNWNEKV